jgi:hypothetical protein
LTEAGEIIEATDERHHEAEVYRLRGDLNVTGDQEAAERSYRRAISAAERQNAKALEVRAATSLARLWRDQGKRDEARDPWILEPSATERYVNRICTSLPSSLRIA